MRKPSVLIMFQLAFLLSVCTSSQYKEQENNADTSLVHQADTSISGANPSAEQLQPYQNETFHFSLSYPSSWQVFEDSMAGNTPVVTVYSSSKSKQPKLPVAIHSPEHISYVSFLPEGLGTEMPFGKSQRLDKFKGEVPVSFALDQKASTVFLLKNGEVWGYFLKPATPPAGWGEYSFIFAQVAIQDFSSQCFDKQTGAPKSPEACDALTGDRVEKRGRINQADREAVLQVLSSIRFSEKENNAQQPIGDLIKVKQPQPNAHIQSPLTVKGEARGYWYFEGQFSVELHNKKHEVLAQSPALAQGKWMTEDFVPFQATLSFNAPQGEQGYVVFRKQNASGLPEHERTYTVPVIFSAQSK